MANNVGWHVLASESRIGTFTDNPVAKERLEREIRPQPFRRLCVVRFVQLRINRIEKKDTRLGGHVEEVGEFRPREMVCTVITTGVVSLQSRLGSKAGSIWVSLE
jgi:hypothetical protein